MSTNSPSYGQRQRVRRRLAFRWPVLWQWATDLRFWALAWFFLGIGMLLAPVFQGPKAPGSQWWYSVIRQPDLVRLLVLVSWSGTVILAGDLFLRRRKRSVALPASSVAVLAGGGILACLLTTWAWTARDVPRAELLVGSKGVDWATIKRAEGNVRVMLPYTFRLASSQEESFEIALSRPGESSPNRRQIAPGAPFQVDSDSYSVLAVEPDSTAWVGMFRRNCIHAPALCGGEEDERTVRGAASDELDFGETVYVVHAVESNFQGVLGPAAQLSEKGKPERFWVFLRDGAREGRPSVLRHPVDLIALRPGHRLVVSVSRPQWSAGLFTVYGLFGLLFAFFAFSGGSSASRASRERDVEEGEQ